MSSEIRLTEMLNICLSLITALSALYLAYAALKHSARPHAKVHLKEPKYLYAGVTDLFIFSFQNTGHWYSQPMVVNMTAYINFDASFEPLYIRYGSIQDIKNKKVKIGKGKMKYLKAKGIKLSYGEDDEQIFVCARNPLLPGKYKIKVSAYSENGLSLNTIFEVEVHTPLNLPFGNTRTVTAP